MSEQVVDVFENLTQEKLEQFTALPKDEQTEILEQAVRAQAATADALLTSDQCYDVLTQLYVDLAKMIFNTQPFLTHVGTHLKELCVGLDDPDAFEKGYKTLCLDIANLTRDLTTLYNSHKDKKGEPTAEELGDVMLIADAYNLLTLRLENAIMPLMQSLLSTIEEASKKEEDSVNE